MRPIFNVPGEGSFPFLMGIISGYPTGAKIVSNFRKNGILTQEESERLLSFTNNSGPLFIIGTVGGALFGNSTIGILLFITHLLASITVGIIFRFWKRKIVLTKSHYRNIENTNSLVSFDNLGFILSSSIMNSIKTIVMIGGFVVLFSVIVSILESSHILDVFSIIFKPIFKILNINPIYIPSILTGIIELTNGAQKIALINTKAISINIIICAFLLGFGGISIMLQILSIISKAKISIKPYIIGKLLQGIFAAIYTYIFIYAIPIFNLNL
jgi:sporulation integral membrane protein YlbJ